MFSRLRQYVSAWLAPCDGKGKALAGFTALLALGFVVYLVRSGSPVDGAFLEKIDSGLKPTPREYGEFGLWWGSLGGLGIALLALKTASWWGKAKPEPFEIPERPVFPEIGPKWTRRALVVGILAAAVLGGTLRAPRLDHSLWNDEEYAVRRNIWGEWERGKDGEMRFDGLDWEEALFFNHNNNHLLHTVTSRVSLAIWQKATGRERGEFREAAVRFVPFLAGIGSILAVGLLGWACGIPLAGVAGAFLLALSPWHMRYAVEARGYSSMIFFILLGLLALLAAVRTGRWRWWFGFGVCQCLFFLCFAGAMYVVVAQSLFLLIYLGVERERRWLIPRWMVSSALTAIPFLLLMGPSIPQIAAYFARDDLMSIPMDSLWLRDLWAHLVSGIPWAELTAPGASPLLGDEAVTHFGTSILDEAKSRPWVSWVEATGIPVLAGFGLVAMAVKNWRTRMLVVVLGFSGGLLFVHNALGGNPTFGWYLIHLTVLFALALPAGVEIAFRGRWRPAAVAILACMVVGYGVLITPAAGLIREHDRQPMRQTVELIRGMAAPEIPLTGVFGTSDRQVKTYDPEVRILLDAGDVDRLIAEGKEQGRPVFVYYCGDVISWQKRPEVAERIASDPGFRRVALVKGLEAMYSYRVFRYVSDE